MPNSNQQDIYKLVQSRKAEFSGLYACMDADKGLYHCSNTAWPPIIPTPVPPYAILRHLS